MSKVDFKKELKELYSPPKKFVLVDVPEMQFLMVDGHGDPNVAQDYQDTLEALYAMAYKIKFTSKVQLGKDYVVPPLEGLWWAEDMETFTSNRDKSQWDWTMMIMTPGWIDGEMFTSGLEAVRMGKNPTALEKVRMESYHEGLSVQIMHIGSYDEEEPTLMDLHQEFLPGNGYNENGNSQSIARP